MAFGPGDLLGMQCEIGCFPTDSEYNKLSLYSLKKSPRILVIRRDNIGDLVCTTPLIRALREQLPDAWIAVLVTSYNMAVMQGNPDIDALFSYTKAKHLKHGESRTAILWSRIMTMLKLRNQRLDWILLPGGPQPSSLRFAKWIGSKHLLVRDQEDVKAGPHQVQQCCHQLVRMGLRFESPAARLSADPVIAARICAGFPHEWNRGGGPVIALHISSRKPSQRWPSDRFAEVARILHRSEGARFILLCSPGALDHSDHPGDDEKAREVLEGTEGLPIHFICTDKLEELVAAISLCDSIICSDGGAMHLAAALGKPLVSLFGDSDPEHWGPWKVPHVVLQKPERNVSEISAEEVVEAYLSLMGVVPA